MEKFEGGRRPTKARSGTKWNFGTVQLSMRDRDEEMNRQIIRRSESSIRSVSKEMMIILFNSTILQGDCHFVEEFVNFEPRRINSEQSQRSSTEEKREKEETGQEQYSWVSRKEKFGSMWIVIVNVIACFGCLVMFGMR
jgi:hypothetical protein